MGNDPNNQDSNKSNQIQKQNNYLLKTLSGGVFLVLYDVVSNHIMVLRNVS
jgi:hypothetical protein